jgi:hypothetical protein
MTTVSGAATGRLGRPRRSYRDFAAELVRQWTTQP